MICFNLKILGDNFQLLIFLKLLNACYLCIHVYLFPPFYIVALMAVSALSFIHFYIVREMAAELVNSATSEKLAEVDWTKNIAICELVAQDQRWVLPHLSNVWMSGNGCQNHLLCSFRFIAPVLPIQNFLSSFPWHGSMLSYVQASQRCHQGY